MEVSQLYGAAMRRWGIPDEVIAQLAHFRARFAGLARSVPAARKLDDGQTLRFGELKFRVPAHPRPHSGLGVLLAGRQALQRGSSLAHVHVQRRRDRRHGCGASGKFLSSLRKILALPNVESLEVFPGHGRPWKDPRPRIAKIFEHHRERTERILTILSDGQALTAFQIAQKLFGRLKDYHVLLGAGEVYAHLEELESMGKVEQSEPHRFPDHLAMKTITLYTKPDCHLCHEAERALHALQQEIPSSSCSLILTHDPRLFERYRYDIPVVAVEGVELCRHRVDVDKVRRALKS
jgi:glutaredoxin